MKIVIDTRRKLYTWEEMFQRPGVYMTESGVDQIPYDGAGLFIVNKDREVLWLCNIQVSSVRFRILGRVVGPDEIFLTILKYVRVADSLEVERVANP